MPDVDEHEVVDQFFHPRIDPFLPGKDLLWLVRVDGAIRHAVERLSQDLRAFFHFSDAHVEPRKRVAFGRA